MEIFQRYKLVIKIINSTVLNKLQSYSRISGFGPEGHCTSRFKRAMCISCRPHVDVHKGGLAHVDRGREVKNPIFLGRHKWMAPIDDRLLPVFAICDMFHCSFIQNVLVFDDCVVACTDLHFGLHLYNRFHRIFV